MQWIRRTLLLGFLALLLISAHADDPSDNGDAAATDSKKASTPDMATDEASPAAASGPETSPTDDNVPQEPSEESAPQSAVAQAVVETAAPKTASAAAAPSVSTTTNQAAAPQVQDPATQPALSPTSTPEGVQAFLRELFRFNASEISQNVQATRDLLRQAEDVNSHVNVANQTLSGAQQAFQTTSSAWRATAAQPFNLSGFLPTSAVYGPMMTAAKRNPPAAEVTTKIAGQRAGFQGPFAFHEVSFSEVVPSLEGELGFFSLYPANTLFFPSTVSPEDIKELRLDFLDYLAGLGIHSSEAVRAADPNTITFAYTQQRPQGGVMLVPSLTGPAATAFISPINRDVRNLKGQVYPRTGIDEVDNNVYRVVEGGFSLIFARPTFVGGEVGLVPAGPGYFNTLVSWESKTAKPPYDVLQTVSYGPLFPVVWPLANTVFYKKPYKRNWPFGNGTAWAAGQATQVQPMGYQVTLTGIEQFSPGPLFPGLSNSMLPHIMDG
eukprot:jgi/Botrbrau1/9884/Bobra.0080s0018.1